MNAKLEINGDTGVAVNAEEGATVHIHVMTGATESKPDPIRRAVHVLLKTCNEANCKFALERISLSLYGSTVFKDLNLEQLGKLQAVAEEVKAALQAQQADDHALFMKEMDEYEEFLRRTGMRASKQERVALTKLLNAFNVRQIRKAWVNSVLVYEDGNLQVKLPQFEPLLGTVGVILSVGSIGLLVLKNVLARPSLEVLLYDALLFVLLIAAIILCTAQSIAPAYIGKRIKARLDSKF